MAGKLLNRLQRLVEECESGGCGPDKDDERKLPNNAPNPKPTLPATGDNLEADAESAGGGTAKAIDVHEAAAGETVISLMPLDVGFDLLSLDPPQRIELPDTPGVLTVVIPAGRIPPRWEKDYPANIRTEGDKTRIRSKHKDFVCKMLRIAGYKVK
jgi:hypothetical protein